MEPTPRMLFVDDRSKRLHYALDCLTKLYDVTLASNVKEALRLLNTKPWDFVSLDHDLSGCDFEDPDTPTCGMEIVRYIEKTGWPTSLQKPYFIIHSTNLFAAHLMTTRLQALGFKVSSQPINEKKDYITYDERGVPK